MMYSTMSQQELEETYQKEILHFESCKSQHLKLNMARGKPSTDQLNAVSGVLKMVQTADDCMDDGIDTRHYGELTGLPSAKA